MRYLLLLTSASLSLSISYGLATPTDQPEMAASIQPAQPAEMPAPVNTIQEGKPADVMTEQTTSTEVKAVEESHTVVAALIGAYRNNTELQQKRHETMSKHEKYVQATAGWRPNVTLSGSMTGSQRNNSGKTKDQSGTPGTSGSSANTREGAVSVTQNLYSGGSTMAEMREADQTIRAAWADLQSAEQQTLFQAAKAFLDLLAKYSEVELLKANKVALKNNLDAAIEKLKIGEETQTQVANAEAKYAEGEAKLLRAQAELEGLKATYTQTTGLQPAAHLKKPEPIQNLPADLKTAVELAKDQSPNVISAQFAHLAAQSETERVGGGLLPTVDLKGSSTRNESRSHSSTVQSATDYRSKDYYTDHRVMVEVKVPLYEGGSIRSKKREAHEVAVSKRVAIENARTQAVQLTIQAWQNYQAAKSNIENYQKQVKASEVSLEGTRQEMAVGSKILLDVLNAQAALLEAQLKLVQAEQAFILESFRLMAAVGLLNAKYLKLPVDYFNPETHYQMTSGRF